MIQDTLLFSTKFNVVPATAKFVLTDLTPYAGEGIALTNAKGVFKIEGPSGVIYNNTNFGAPDIAANISLIFNTVSLPLDTDGEILTGNYTITYTVRIAGGIQPGDYIKMSTVYFCYEAPAGKVEVANSVRLAKVTSKDLTSYPISGVMPTLTRTHTLWYPSPLGLSPTVSSAAEIQLSYPNVYTGTYSGKISTVASYVFTDGLIVDYLITAVDETIVDNKTLCDIYCGIKNLTNEMLTAKSTGDFGKSDRIQETLSLVSILFTLYDDAITCGKEDDATNWLNQIITLANITVGCGCTGDEPTQVIPEGGGGSGNDVIVVGDNAFGTEVASNTVGSTTTYTVRLTQVYKDLILSALQTQDLSVAAFRAAGIPEEVRGVTVTPVTSGGGTISLTPGTSKKVLVLTGTATLSSALTVQTVGSPIDGDSFIVDYRATLTPNGNNVTIFGLGLSPSEAASGNCLIYTWYAASNTTWYAKLISNQPGSAVQDGLAFWVNGSDYALNKTVLFGTNPSLIYRNILSAGSGTNPPSGTTADNTYWEFVGNKSALYDASNNVVFDVTTGQPVISATLATAASSTDMLVLDGQQIKKRAFSTFTLAGTTLSVNKFLMGDGFGLAAEFDFNATTFRTYNIPGITGSFFFKTALVNSGTITIDPALATPTYVLEGTVTLIANVNVVANVATSKFGDYLWIDYKAAATLGGNSLTILGVSISATEALAGNFGIYGYFDSVSSVWVGRKITYGVTVPIGTANQTVRYNASNVLESDPNVTQDASGNLTALNSVRAGTTHTGTGQKNVIGGANNAVNGFNNLVVGTGNTVPSNNNKVNGSGNTVSGIGCDVSGSANIVFGSRTTVQGGNNAVADSDAMVVGLGNTAIGIKCVIGENNAGTGGGYSIMTGVGNNLVTTAFAGKIDGFYGVLRNPYSKVFSNSLIAKIGHRQREVAIHSGQTTNATPTLLAPGGGGWFLMENNQVNNIFVQVSAIQSAGGAGSVGDSHIFVLKAAVKCVAGVYSLVGTQVVDGNIFDAAATAWTATVGAYVGGFQIIVTGEASKTIEWTASITTVNAGY